MPRLEYWETKLNKFIEEHLNKPQKWGEVDCCMTVGNMILATTGKDPLKKFRGKYKTEIGAGRQIKKAGGDLLGAADKICEEFGFEEVPNGFGQRGDVRLVIGDNGQALAFIGPGGKTWCSGKTGLDEVNKEQFIKTWRIN